MGRFETMPPPSKYKAPMPPPPLSDSNHRTTSNNDLSGLLVYQVWKGNNVFCLGGRLIFGPDVRSISLTLFLILTPVILFCAFVSGRLKNEFPHHQGNLVVAICLLFTAYDIALLFLTSSRDPGIIPRNPHPPVEDGSSISADWPGFQDCSSNIPPTKEVKVNGLIVRVKYCQTCMLYRPPRCSHCSVCNNCVERFDHHCPWVGQCIGKRNYRFFFMFVSSTTLLCLYVFAFCWVSVRKTMGAYHCNLWSALMKSPVSGILILYTFVCAWFVGGLTAFHSYLVLTNQTTYENFRYRYDRKLNPYNRGFVCNIKEIFFSKIPKSKNNFRENFKVEPSLFVPSPLGHTLSPDMPKSSIDLEMGKRQAVADEDFEDIQRQINSISGLERCSTMPTRHPNWEHKPEWEMTPDIQMLAAELEHNFTDRQKISGDL